MSLRKFVSLLLLVAFTLTAVPAQAATLESSATLPTAVQESGTIANGANLDVVPVTITVDDIAGGSLELTVIQYDVSGAGNDAANGATLSITANGKLTIGGNGTILGGSDEKAFIITPPTGTKFVGLAHQDYETNGVTMFAGDGTAGNGALVTENVGGDIANGVLPGAGDNGNAAIARVITSAGPSSYFGTGVTVPAGSIVAYFATGDNNVGSNPIATSFQLTNFGLAVNPTGESSGTLTGNLSATYEEPGAGALIDEALGGGLADGATIAIAAIVTGEKLEFGMAANEDSQANTVLGVLLSSAGNGVAISPAQITSTSSASSLKVDTDALYIRAKQVTTGVYYQTPFATSEYSGSIIDVNGGVSTFNKEITSNSSTFPNAEAALISVDFKVMNPSTNTEFASTDASIDVSAVSVSLVGEDIDTDIRGAITEANGGFLGSIITSLLDNGGSAVAEADSAIAVLYNGTSNTSALVVKDATAVDYSAPTTAVGLDGTAAFTVVPAASTGATTSTVSPFVGGIFEGSFVASEDASAANGRAPVAVSAVNGTQSTTFKFTLAGAVPGHNAGEGLFTPSEVTVRLTDTTNGANAWFVITGNTAGDDLTDAAGEIRVGPTNSATSAGAIIGTDDDAAVGIANNVIAIATLNGNTLHILPISNLIDGERDAIIIRPEIALTMKTTAARTAGAKVVAVASGNNLAETTTTVAQVTGTGSLEADVLVKAVPVNGNVNRLMVENGIDAFNGRALINISTIDGSTTSLDNYTDLIDNGAGLVLDETLPSLFCGGTIGNGEKGPNAVVSQARAMGILISENGQTNAFSTVADNSNTAIRVTLPAGWDINHYSATQGEILSAFSTGGLASFDVADFDVHGINSDAGVSQAYVDIDGFTLVTTNDMDRAFVLVFLQNALVAPAGVTDFTATITMVYNNGTSSTADDTLLASLGTVELGTECATGLSLGFCPDVISSASTVSSQLESDLTSNGANLTTFSSTPTGSLRMIQPTSAETVLLPDLCIGEGAPDLFAVGNDEAGGTDSTHYVYIVPSATNTAAVEFANVVPTLTNTDNSITLSDGGFGSWGGSREDYAIEIDDNANDLRPDQATSRIRVSGLTLLGPTTGVNPAQDLLAFLYDANNYVVGNELAIYSVEDSVNGDAIVTNDSANPAKKMAAHFYNADVLDDVALTVNGFDSASDDNLEFVFSNTNAPMISSAVTNLLDDDNYQQLSSSIEDQISVDVSDITGSTSKKVIVSAQAGTLEPNSRISVTLSGAGSSDSVSVPVLADGSFQATITADTTQTIVLQQFPSSSRTDLPPQVLQLDVADANVEPRLLSATVSNLGLGAIPAKGKVPVVVTLTATGKVDGSSYVPVASELTIGGSPATAVTGSTTKFIALVDPAQPITVASTAGDGSSVIATGLTTAATTKGGKPNLVSKFKNDKLGRLTIKGKRLGRADGSFAFLNADGTVTTVILRDATKGDKRKNRRKSESAVTIPSNALYGIFISPSRGVDAELVN